MNQLEYRRSIQVAHNFLTRCFAPGEFIAFLLRSEHPVTVMQRVVLLERAVAPRYLGWLAHQNAAGANSLFCSQSASLRHSETHQRKRLSRCDRYTWTLILKGEAKLSALQN